MEFLTPSLLTIGLPLIALPPLIHLINLRRRRRIAWAAMDFLLESQKRNRRWILLKQLLLMLMRTAAIALAVFMLAGPVLQSGWGALFGRGVTHHVILLDDSYSMSDQAEMGSVFERGKQAVAQILRQARGRSEQQAVTLLRFSQAAQYVSGAKLEFDRRSLDAEMLAQLDEMLVEMTPSETDAGPLEALGAATRLPEPRSDETRIAYVLSDFREPQWNEAAQLQQLAARLNSQCDDLQLIQCVQQTRANLAITHLAPESGLRAAGVETWIEISVANYGDESTVGVTAAIEQDGRQLPAVEFDEILPGETATRRFRATFADAGGHQLRARLESDAIEVDNHRFFAARIPPSFPVLIIDGSTDGDDGFYLSNSLSPGGLSLAGWSPQIERPGYLRRAEAIDRFAAVFLLDVPRMDDADVTVLEQYVSAGGGVAVFLGPNAQRPYYNDRLYRDGEGLLPAPLGVPTQMLRAADGPNADVLVTDHPIFGVFRGQRNSFLASANVEFFYAIEGGVETPLADGSKVIATLRNGAPFVVERRFGEGRVIVQLCKLSPKPTNLGAWSNWALNPVFPVYANELTGFLSALRRSYDVREVGSEVNMTMPEEQYQRDVQIRLPSSVGGEQIGVTAAAEGGRYLVEAPMSRSSGVWEFMWTRRAGLRESHYVAVNVPVGEGDLHHLQRADLTARLPGVAFSYSLASDLSSGDEQLAGFNLSDALLYLLAVTLVFEQLLAFSTSYHGAGGKGGE